MNTVTVSRVQTEDKDINQLQSNIINALQRIGQNLNAVTIIGELKLSPLTESQFQSQAGSNWISCDGRSIVRSAYAKLGNVIVAPSLAPLGTNNFYLRIN